MNPILFADHLWFLAMERDQGKAMAQLLTEEGNELSNAYRLEIQSGAGLIRTPTLHCNRSFLRKHGLEERVEAIHNVALQTARDCLTKMNADALLCGVVGPLLEEEEEDQDHWQVELQRQVAEPAIYLIDKGADCLQLEGYVDPEKFKLALKSLRKVNQVPVPISAVFRLSPAHGPEVMAELIHYAAVLEIELIGFELSLEEAAQLPEPMGEPEIAVGFQIRAGLEPITDELIEQGLKRILGWNPTMMLGGMGLGREDWQRVKARCQTLSGQN